MGNSPSQEDIQEDVDVDSQQQKERLLVSSPLSPSSNRLASSRGFHVLRVIHSSPAAKAYIEPYFDFILSINTIPLNTLSPFEATSLLSSTAQQSTNSTITFQLFNTRTETLRTVRLKPNATSSSSSSRNPIGVSVRYCDFSIVQSTVWRVLDIRFNSPAAIAGFIPYTDYIIGSPQMNISAGSTGSTNEDFFNMVLKSINNPLPLYVYNSDSETIREVVVVPSRDWSANSDVNGKNAGVLGCDIGFGFAHRIPVSKRLPRTVVLEEKVGEGGVREEGEHQHDHSHHDHSHEGHDHEHEHKHEHDHHHHEGEEHKHDHDHDHDHPHPHSPRETNANDAEAEAEAESEADAESEAEQEQKEPEPEPEPAQQQQSEPPQPPQSEKVKD